MTRMNACGQARLPIPRAREAAENTGLTLAGTAPGNASGARKSIHLTSKGSGASGRISARPTWTGAEQIEGAKILAELFGDEVGTYTRGQRALSFCSILFRKDMAFAREGASRAPPARQGHSHRQAWRGRKPRSAVLTRPPQHWPRFGSERMRMIFNRGDSPGQRAWASAIARHSRAPPPIVP